MSVADEWGDVDESEWGSTVVHANVQVPKKERKLPKKIPNFS